MSQKEDNEERFATKPFRVYYKKRLTDVDEIRKDIVRNIGSWSHQNLCVDKHKESNGLLPWRCFECHTRIYVDIDKLTGKSMFCNKHKPERFDNRFKQNPILLKYIDSFFTSVKKLIMKNTNTNLYG
ncbi:hypothetical protein BPT24_115 [Tenacibaculum phage pT24]|uniref:Uncharacterized protein n=1 Tax=Tenacibaculum phage pT24 TaxID=1880590 RepID=A0A1B4XWP5_9CAUD|nr:hypothetical protein HYP10_gp115 [Tenacibaculum phage pT24]BAV39240.1 hypothetical protein BPT24_115 [Tenacibaculum phage pT24]